MLTNRLTSRKIDLEEVLALHLCTRGEFERADNFPGRCADHVAGRRICIASVEAERHPSRLAGQLDRRERRRRISARIKDVEPVPHAVGHPELTLVRRERDAM